MRTNQTAKVISQKIAEAALAKSKDVSVQSPFNLKKAVAIVKMKNSHGYKTNSILTTQQRTSSISMSSEFEEMKLETHIHQDEDFENLCVGKGKPDDITVVSTWILNRGSH